MDDPTRTPLKAPVRRSITGSLDRQIAAADVLRPEGVSRRG
jgi:hypothetical protein